MSDHSHSLGGGESSSSSLRPLSCDLSILSDANGSAVWKSGGTMVLASCHGPTAPRQAQSIAGVSDAKDGTESRVLVQVLVPSNLRHSSEWEIFLTNVLSACVRTESCPEHSVIQVVLQIQSDDGSLLAACVHASVSALMDASIELNYLPVAVTCLVSGGTNDCHLDPTLAQEDQDEAGLLTMIVVLHNNTSPGAKDSVSRMGGIWTSGIQASPQDILKCWKLAKQAAPAVTAFWRMALTHKHQRHATTLFYGMNHS